MKHLMEFQFLCVMFVTITKFSMKITPYVFILYSRKFTFECNQQSTIQVIILNFIFLVLGALCLHFQNISLIIIHNSSVFCLVQDFKSEISLKIALSNLLTFVHLCMRTVSDNTWFSKNGCHMCRNVKSVFENCARIK